MKKLLILLCVCALAVTTWAQSPTYAGRKSITMPSTNGTVAASLFANPVRAAAIYVKYAAPTTTTFTVTAQLNSNLVVRSAVMASNVTSIVIIPDNLYIRRDAGDALLFHSTATGASVLVDFWY